MTEWEQMDQPLRELIEIIHFTENVSAKIHGLLDEAEIYRTVNEEFAKSKRYAASILLLTDDGSKLRIAETSLPPGKLEAGEKAVGLRLEGYQIDLNKSSTYRQVVTEGKTVRSNVSEVIGELFPRPLACLISKTMGYEKSSSILTPLKRHGEIIGALAMSSTELAEYFIPSMRNLARHISTALELADEHTERLSAEQSRKRAEEALRRAHDELEIRVQERTAELAKANQSLQAEITERAWAEEALELRVEQLAALSRASQAVTASLELGQVLAEIVSLASKVVPSDYASVVLVDETGHLGQSAETVPGVPAIEYRVRDEGLTSWVVHSRQAVVIDEIGEDGAITPHLGEGAPRFANPLIVEVGIKSVAGLPLQVKGHLLGVLYFHSLHPGAFHGQLPLLTAFANQAAIAVDNARLYEALRESEEKYRNLVERANDGIAIVQDAIIKYVNPVLAEIAGYTVEELIGTPFTRYVHPDDLPRVVDLYKRRMAGEDVAPIYEIVVRHKDDGKIYVELNAGMITHQGKPADFVIVRDITERRRMEERIRGQERLAAVGQLAAGIAHDFNNILTAIIGFAQLLHMRTDMSESARADLKQIVEGGHRAARLIRQILDFSRKSLIRRQPLDLVPFLKEAVKFLQCTIPESVDIVLEIGPDEYLVHADPAQIQQVLSNLAVNARDAMPEGGELRIGLSRFTLKPDDRRPFPSMKPGEWITLSVSDTGTGISPEVLPHLYEPFFTTKGVGKGTGLGLAQAYGIVKQHEGFIDVETKVGKGTTFIIYLSPLAVPEKAPREEVPKTPRGQGETILVVEDEPQVLGVSKAMLEHLGYRVLTAANGLQALDLYNQHREEVALVLADMVMPKMGGVELFQALRARDPEVKMVVMTGYPLMGVEGRALLERGIVDWVLKPMDLVQLAQVVKRALK